ncbi:hypothetical protein XpopCFBP1817_04530 [Xanthomonas populi]|uniref:Uncharacterized protein n=1 Tax=Xanthomonas populi TaxID=53414 RepID=A0A2S7EY64_9XANT|nr:hypothetical protein [Xanthomonas populi]PPU98054.1 hypothetical protein XpopCFBP1817_04530 [Xanthomonas populi]
MQVASELATFHGSSARATGSVSHCALLTTAMLVALGLVTAPSAFAAVLDFNSNDTIASSRMHADG